MLIPITCFRVFGENGFRLILQVNQVIQIPIRKIYQQVGLRQIAIILLILRLITSTYDDVESAIQDYLPNHPQYLILREEPANTAWQNAWSNDREYSNFTFRVYVCYFLNP